MYKIQVAKNNFSSSFETFNVFLLYVAHDGNENSCQNLSLKSPGDNTPENNSYTATYRPSRKLSKLDEPYMQDTAGEAGMSS